MRLINDGDERLFHTVTVAARLGRSGRIIKTLMADYDEYWDDPEAGFRYALALIAMIQAGGSEQDKRTRYTQSMEALDDVIDSEPGHWLARYCRARHRVVIRTGYGRYQEYLNDERDQAVEDTEELLRGQEQVDWQPYFVAGYMLAAQFHAGQGDPQRAAALISKAGGRPRGTVPYPTLGSILREPFLILRHGTLPAAAKAVVGATMADLFPGSPARRPVAPAGATV
jgi:hypothetical protein